MLVDKKEAQVFIDWIKLKIKINFCNELRFYFKEREIWWVSLGKNIGDEQNGKHKNFEHPVLILKNFNNKVLWIVPLTSQNKSLKYYHQFEYQDKKYSVVLSQLRLVSYKRLVRKVRTLPEDEFFKIKEKIKNFI